MLTGWLPWLTAKYQHGTMKTSNFTSHSSTCECIRVQHGILKNKSSQFCPSVVAADYGTTWLAWAPI